MVSVSYNTIANYFGHIYVALIGIVFLPLYLQYLGPEAYGLVGFFSVAQSWLMLLDMGMSPTLGRQIAHARGRGGAGFVQFLPLLRSVEIVFLILFAVSSISVWLLSSSIAAHWLHVHLLSLSDVSCCIGLMGVTIGLRWLSSLYRSGIQGMECQLWLNVSNVIIVTLRFVGALMLLRWVSSEVVHFFEFQLVVGIIELFIRALKFYAILPVRNSLKIGFSYKALKEILPFSGSIAYIAVLWTILTQVDKLILSHTLSLSEYGYFSLVAVVATGIISFSGPLTQAILPRMTYMFSQGKESEMLALYRKGSHFLAIFIFPLAGTVALYSSELLYAWTGDVDAAVWAGPVLSWYALGSGVMAVAGIQYVLQLAYGKVRLHVINSTINAIVQVPLIVFSAFHFGAYGVAVTWFALRVVTFLIWPPVIHRHFSPGLHSKWLLEDIAPVFLITIFCLMLSSGIKDHLIGLGRIEAISAIGIICLVCMMLNLAVLREGRILLGGVLGKWINAIN